MDESWLLQNTFGGLDNTIKQILNSGTFTSGDLKID